MHNHGQIYRAKIVSIDGRTEYGEWFESAPPRDSMQGVTRALGKRYCCEAKRVRCTERSCDVDPTPRVIASLQPVARLPRQVRSRLFSIRAQPQRSERGRGKRGAGKR
jgi:hypothetical protein